MTVGTNDLVGRTRNCNKSWTRLLWKPTRTETAKLSFEEFAQMVANTVRSYRNSHTVLRETDCFEQDIVKQMTLEDLF
jgi:hypothetical protein